MVDDQLNVTLINLGYATKFMESPAEHKKNKFMDKFCGNLLFASINQMNF